MASNLLKHLLHTKLKNPATSSSPLKTHYPATLFFPSTPFPNSIQNPSFSFAHQHKPTLQSGIRSLPPEKEKLTDPPPTTKEEAISQVKTCLAKALEKPLNNPQLTGKLKRLKQPRFRVEIPLVEDSPESLALLARNVFGELPIRRKGMSPEILIFWTEPISLSSANRAMNSIRNVDLSLVKTGLARSFYRSSDVAVFMAPDLSQLELIGSICKEFEPKPVVIFNPKWDFDEESGYGGIGGFLSSFEVAYSFMGLEVKGILSKRRGVVYRCVKDGVVSGGEWQVLVEENGEFRVVSKFKKRPSAVEVENVLYNLMAVNSPVTKSVKFLRDLVSRVGGLKEKQ